MKKAAVVIAAWLCCALSVQATTTKPKPVTQERTIGIYQSLKVDGPFSVTLSKSDSNTITLKGAQQMLDLIVTEVTNGTLKIALKPGSIATLQKVIINVPYQLLNKIDLIGSGNISVGNTLKNDIKVSVDGCGSIKLRANSQNVEAYLLGQGEIKLKGKANTLNTKVIGCGQINAYDLAATTVEASVAGSGAIHAHCTKAITGRISGSGKIVFTGNPTTKDLKRNGQGEFTML